MTLPFKFIFPLAGFCVPLQLKTKNTESEIYILCHIIIVITIIVRKSWALTIAPQQYIEKETCHYYHDYSQLTIVMSWSCFLSSFLAHSLYLFLSLSFFSLFPLALFLTCVLPNMDVCWECVWHVHSNFIDMITIYGDDATSSSSSSSFTRALVL